MRRCALNDRRPGGGRAPGLECQDGHVMTLYADIKRSIELREAGGAVDESVHISKNSREEPLGLV